MPQQLPRDTLLWQQNRGGGAGGELKAMQGIALVAATASHPCGIAAALGCSALAAAARCYNLTPVVGCFAMAAIVGCCGRVVETLQRTATLLRVSGQWDSCNSLPRCLGAVGSATPSMHCLTAWGHWAMELVLCTAPLPRGSGQWNSSNAVPHSPGVVGSAAHATHFLIA